MTSVSGRPERLRRATPAALLLLLTGGVGAPTAAADPAVQCPGVPVSVTAPAPGATVEPGPVTVGGSAAAADRTLAWELQDATGQPVAAGQVTSVATGAAGRFTVPLTLAEGSYGLAVRDLAAADGDLCAATRVALTVAPGDAGPRWESGASGTGSAEGTFGEWRGSAVPLTGTWVDDNQAQVGLWPLQPGAALGSWTGDLELTVGAIDQRAGETWAAAAQGAYDARWAQSLQNTAALWEGRPGALYVRFAHEFNGDWYPWSVTAASAGDFVTAWKRYRGLQQQYLPAAQLVFSPAEETSASSGLDWRLAFPGSDQADLVTMSYFNGWPTVTTAAEFQELAMRVDPFGAPRGIERHREFAESVGLPFAVSEWGNSADFGDSPSFVEQMYGFFNAHAGSGPGQVRYEIFFNVEQEGDQAFVFHPGDRNRLGAEVYRALW